MLGRGDRRSGVRAARRVDRGRRLLPSPLRRRAGEHRRRRAARRGRRRARRRGGDDAWGEWLRGRLADEGVDLRWFSLVDGLRTPVAFVTFDRDGEPSFQIYGDGIEACVRAAGERLPDAIGTGDALVFGSNTLVAEPERNLTLRARRLALDRDIPVLFDPNVRPHRWRELEQALELCRRLCEGAYLVRANLVEARSITGADHAADAATELVAMGARIAVVTRGGGGAVMRGAASADEPGVEVEVTSPLGAGDAFMGMLAARLAAGDWSPEAAPAALTAAVEAGARACIHWGAIA
ncbi:MAG TPA: PfkB family carbohydrate kinase [Solirubrobacterales bacterium]|nr:PfkB family carbohydrate kinase [Solirubrobacterales bacterium]